VNRFKHRAEWLDKERLLAVAEDDTLPGGPEDRLTAEFARYLFDQGLSPLTRPMTGGLQPDLLDPRQSFTSRPSSTPHRPVRVATWSVLSERCMTPSDYW
jgi:hypothetical protein